MKKNIRVFVNTERCKGCGYCRSVCPKEIIQMSEDFNTKGYHYAFIVNSSECSGCRFCAVICPDVAIEIEAVEQWRSE